jgi:hypothetical protein
VEVESVEINIKRDEKENLNGIERLSHVNFIVKYSALFPVFHIQLD